MFEEHFSFHAKNTFAEFDNNICWTLFNHYKKFMNNSNPLIWLFFEFQHCFQRSLFFSFFKSNHGTRLRESCRVLVFAKTRKQNWKDHFRSWVLWTDRNKIWKCQKPIPGLSSIFILNFEIGFQQGFVYVFFVHVCLHKIFIS